LVLDFGIVFGGALVVVSVFGGAFVDFLVTVGGALAVVSGGGALVDLFVRVGGALVVIFIVGGNFEDLTGTCTDVSYL